LEETDVFDVEDDLEDPEPEEVVEDDEVVLDRDDEGVVNCLELEVPRRGLMTKCEMGRIRPSNVLRLQATYVISTHYTMNKEIKHSRAGTELEYALAASEPQFNHPVSILDPHYSHLVLPG
jgi:hypothetical protein